MDRRTVMLDGIAALRDATRALRGVGGASGTDSEAERGALFELAALADRLTSFADDQHDDDWDEFWVTVRDVDTLRRHLGAVAALPRGLSASTVPTLRRLADTLATLTQPEHEVGE